MALIIETDDLGTAVQMGASQALEEAIWTLHTKKMTKSADFHKKYHFQCPYRPLQGRDWSNQTWSALIVPSTTKVLGV
jgi:hypothetical protein